MKKPTSRKQQLSNRSFRYAYGVTRDELYYDDPHATRAAYAWQDGYRAAMRDRLEVRTLRGRIEYPTLRCVHCTLVRCYHPELVICDECLKRIEQQLQKMWDEKHK